MPTRLNIAMGRQFGFWTVEAEDTPFEGKRRFTCRCICGTLRPVLLESLQSTASQHCGCMRLRARKSDSAFRILLAEYRRNDAAQRLGFTLTYEHVKLLTSSACFYFGREPFRVKATRLGNVYVYNGIDRMDNRHGYIQGNVVPCCWPCNNMKGARSTQEFLADIRRIAARHA